MVKYIVTALALRPYRLGNGDDSEVRVVAPDTGQYVLVASGVSISPRERR